MAAKTPIRTIFTDGVATGLAEFQTGEFIDYQLGGTGVTALGTAGQVLKVNSGASALEWGGVEAILNIEGLPDGTGITVAGTDKLALSDGGTEKQVNISQLGTIFAGDTQTLTNKSIDLGTNTLTGSVAEFNSALQSESFSTLTGTETLTNKTLASPTFTTNFTIGSATITEAELEILDGATASTTELNYLDITTLGTSQASKAVTVDSDGDLIIPDSDKFEFGAGSDMTLYHDGTNSYITNKTGALKIATETSGIALTIGHGTSETTVAGNLTVTGNYTVNGLTTTIATANTTLEDNLLELNSGAGSNANDSGIIIERGSTGDNAIIMWDESGDEFTFGTTTATASGTGNLTTADANLRVSQLTAATYAGAGIKDEDTLSSNSATHLATQQSIKAYVDSSILTKDNTDEIAEGSTNLYYTTARWDTKMAAADTGDLGEGSNLYYTDARADARITNALIDEDNMATDSATKLPSQQSVKAYVDSQIHEAGDITSIVAGTGLSGSSLTGPIPTLTIDTGTTVDKTTAQTLTNKTLTSPVLNTGISGTAIKDEDDLTSNSATHLATQQSIKAYVDAQILTKDNTDEIAEGSTNLYYTDARADARIANNIIDEDAMGTDSATRAPSQQSVKAFVASQILTKDNTDEITEGSNLYFTNARADARITNALKDEDDFASNSATHLASQQSIKAYVDAQTTDEVRQDIIGAMLTGNTETLITVTYQDSDGTVDFVVDNDLANYDNSNSSFITGLSTTTLTNKTFDVDGTGNSLSNIANANIKAAAAIDAAKIADGSISNAEYQYLNGVSSNVQTQLNAKATSSQSIAFALALG